jgi:hypothetical protein
MRALVAETLALLLCVATFTAQAQNLTYLRENIQSWAEPQKSRALGLMNRCRPVADDFVSSWPNANAAEIYPSLGKEFRDNTPFREFAKLLDVMERAYGRVTASEFRNEMLLIEVGDSPALLRRPAIEVVYSVETTRPSKSEVFFEIYLAEGGGLCRVVGMRYQQYLNAIPPWLRRKPMEKTST